ncbi:hypothetical protein NDU88_005566 [Pleurodeles waltl]|uniref:Uncharacterized protein n=1 Tax=Pleurodeles waltl TaxID=8319 RepID=A0AAV7NMV0_PLEWA|nr:hypothetical protein NDU88_005566 [Pleurodeles waltl]
MGHGRRISVALSPHPSMPLYFAYRIWLSAHGREEEDIGQQRAVESGPNEKKRHHRILKYSTGPAGRVEWPEWTHGAVPLTEEYRTLGRAPRDRLGTCAKRNEVSSDCGLGNRHRPW